MNNIFILTITIIISGCTSTGTLKNSSYLKSQNKGQILTENASFLVSINPLGQTLNLGIKSIGNNEFQKSIMSGYPTEVDTHSGTHKVTLVCYGVIDGIHFGDPDDLEVTIDVQAGQQYLLKPKLIGRYQCGADIEVITNKKS
jgi:hypothetical protein